MVVFLCGCAYFGKESSKRKAGGEPDLTPVIGEAFVEDFDCVVADGIEVLLADDLT